MATQRRDGLREVDDIAEIKAGTRQLLTGQDEIKAMLVQIAGGGGGGGASSARAKAQEVYRAMQAAAGCGGAPLPRDGFVLIFEGEFLNGEDLPDALTEPFLALLDRDGDGTISGPEWTKVALKLWWAFASDTFERRRVARSQFNSRIESLESL